MAHKTKRQPGANKEKTSRFKERYSSMTRHEWSEWKKTARKEGRGIEIAERRAKAHEKFINSIKVKKYE